jgi:WD40 repeat protein
LDAKTGKTISRFAELEQNISSDSLAFSADGTFIVRRTHGGFQVFDVRQGKTTFAFRSPFLEGNAIAISPDGRHVATGIFDGIGVWDLSLDAPCQTMTHERYQQGTRDISTWGTCDTGDLKVVSVSTDGSLCIWRYKKPFMELVRKFTHQTDSEGNKFATFSPDGRLFAVINSGMRYTLNTVSLYDSYKNSLHAKVIEHSDGVHSDVLSGTFFERFPSVWALPEGARIDIEDLRHLHNYSARTHELATRDLRPATWEEQDSLQRKTTNQPLIAENGELLIRRVPSGSVIAYYPPSLLRVQPIPIPDSWAASSRAGLEILSLENSSSTLW